MRPYNTYRNPELSQPVSSVENTLTEKTSNSNASFDILRSLSESISVDCGSFEISAPTEYYPSSSVPSHVAFVDPKGKEIRTPVESVPSTPVRKEPSISTQVPRKPSVNAALDMDDDNYDCMNDPNYRTQSVKETNSPSFEELMARTAEGIARMREETSAAISDSENSKKKQEPANGNNSNTIRTETKSDAKPSEMESSSKKSFGANVSWNNIRKKLFSRETIKLVVLSVAISALFVSAVIYRSSQRRNNGLPESDDVVVNPAESIQSDPVQRTATDNNNKFVTSNNGDYWGQSDNNWNDPVASNPHVLTDPLQNDYQSPTFDGNQIGYDYNQNGSDSYLNPEDAGRPLASPHNSNNGNQFAETIPAYNVEPKYAEIAPAIGSGYNPNEYESPVLEDDSVRGYSETGYNSNYMR